MFSEVPPKLSENAHGLSSDHILAGEKNPPRGISIFPTFGLDFIGYTCNQLVTSAVRTKRRAGVTERGGSDSAIRLWTGPGLISTGNMGFGIGELRFVGGGSSFGLQNWLHVTNLVTAG